MIDFVSDAKEFVRPLLGVSPSSGKGKIIHHLLQYRQGGVKIPHPLFH
jgi:hypothetical protein